MQPRTDLPNVVLQKLLPVYRYTCTSTTRTVRMSYTKCRTCARYGWCYSLHYVRSAPLEGAPAPPELGAISLLFSLRPTGAACSMPTLTTVSSTCVLILSPVLSSAVRSSEGGIAASRREGKRGWRGFSESLNACTFSLK